MKKNVRNALAISGLALAIGASGLTLTASANSANSRMRSEKHQSLTKIERARKVELIKQSHRRTIPGVVSAISADSLAITKGNKTFTVSTSQTTRVLDRTWKSITLSDIKEGDKVRVLGTISGTTITAKTIRNISIPTPVTK